jgi:hypothetical protein
MKNIATIFALHSFLLIPFAGASELVSSMNAYYSQNDLMCIQKKNENAPMLAAAAANPASWFLSVAPKKEKTMLASCCTLRPNSVQANAQ